MKLPRFEISLLAIVAVATLTAATGVANAQAAPATAAVPTTRAHADVEPKAAAILKAACDKLAAAKSMSFTAIVTYESPSRFGFPLAYGTKSEVLMERPDKLRVLTPGDGPASDFYYDGKTMTAYSPAEDLVAVAPAPPTTDDMLETAFHSAAIYFPFDDVIVSDPWKDISQDLRVAFYVGQSDIVGGVKTDIVAYDTGGVFIQAWIGADDKLPRMLRAIYDSDPLHTRHVLFLSDWKLDVHAPSDAFVTNKAATAKHIPFASPSAPVGMPKPASKP
jgi:hypothetical protein